MIKVVLATLLLVVIYWENSAAASLVTLDNKRYDAFGIIARFSSGKWVIAYRSGADHTTGGVIKIQTSIDQINWTAPATIYSENAIEIRCCAGGLTRTGRLILFFWRDKPDLTYLSSHYIYSDDEATTFSPLQDFSTTMAPHGGLIEINGDKLLQPGYDGKGNLYVQTSSNNGDSWSPAVKVATGLILLYSEPSCVYLGSDNILCLVRADGGTRFRQFKSTDNGASWRNQGDATFDLHGPANITTCNAWLQTYMDGETRKVVAYYCRRDNATRANNYVKAIYGVASDLFLSGPSAWDRDSIVTIASNLPWTSGGSGYPSVIPLNDGPNGLGQYYSEVDTNRTTINLFTVSEP